MSTSYLFAASVVLLVLGVYLVLSRKNAILALMGIELILNAANVNFVAFNRLHAAQQVVPIEGQATSLFIIVLAAAEAAVALAMVLQVYQRFGRISLSEVDELKG